MESSQRLISMSFRKLNSGKSQKSGIDLRKNLLVFTVISACRSQRKLVHVTSTRKRPASLDFIDRADSKKKSKQPLASFENAFLKNSSSVSELGGQQEQESSPLCHSLESDEDESDSSLPTQVPYTYSSSQYQAMPAYNEQANICLTEKSSNVQSVDTAVSNALESSSSEINIIVNQDYLSVANTFLSSERSMNDISDRSESFGTPHCLPVAAY